jgi:peptidyl-prolyl cis-trans isomerase A (cyclophilin A)
MHKSIILAVVCVLAACDQAKKEPAPASGGTAKLTGAGETEVTLEQATEGLPKEGKLMAEIVTDLGSIHCELLPDAAPKTVASFVGLARGTRSARDPARGKSVKEPFYDGLAFHRVIPGFMIQGGDPLSRTYDSAHIGTGGPGFTLPDEIPANLKFDKPGVMAMANKGPRTHTAGSQFFITEKPYPSLDGGYAIFGQCGDLNVVEAVAKVPVGPNDKPKSAVTMKVKIYRK